MANKYWVGGGCTYDYVVGSSRALGTFLITDSANWSDTSGGVAGAVLPTSADSVYFDSNSGTPGYIIVTGANFTCLNFNISIAGWTIYGYNASSASSNEVLVYDSATVVAGNFFNAYSTNTLSITPSKTTGIGTYTLNGCVQHTLNVRGNVSFGSDNTTITNATTIYGGTLYLPFTFTTGSLIYGTSNAARGLNWVYSSSKIVITGNSGIVYDETGADDAAFVTNSALYANNGYCNIEFLSSSLGFTRTIILGSSSAISTTSYLKNFKFLNGNTTDIININTFAASGRDAIVSDLNFNGFTGTVNLNCNLSIYGALIWGEVLGSDIIGTAYNITFVGSTTTSGTANPIRAISIGYHNLNVANIIFDSSYTYKLTENLSCGSSGGITVKRGILDINSKTLTALTLNISSDSLNTSTIAFGTTGKIILKATSGDVISCANTDPYYVTITGTPTITLTPSTAPVPADGERRIALPKLTEATAITLNVTNGSNDLVFLSLDTAYNDLNFTGYSGQIVLVTSIRVFGNLTIPAAATTAQDVWGSLLKFEATSGTKTISTNGVTINIPLGFYGVGGTWQLSNNLTVSSTNKTILSNGTLDLNNFTLSTGTLESSTGLTRAIGFGTTSKIILTSSPAAGESPFVWSSYFAAGLSITGTSRVELSSTTSVGTRQIKAGIDNGTESNSINFYVTSGTDTIAITASSKIRTLDYTGFSGIMTATSGVTIYGDLVFSSGMTINSTSSAMTMGSTSGTKTITTAGKTLNMSLIFNGVGGTWSLNDALTLGTGSGKSITLTNGTLNTNDNNVTISDFNSSNSNTRALNLGSSQFRVARLLWNTAIFAPMSISFTRTATINMSYSSAKTFSGGGGSFPKLSQGGTGQLTITGSNTFAELANSVNGTTILLPASSTTTVDVYSLIGIERSLTTLSSGTSGTKATLSLSSYTGPSIATSTYMNIKDINFTPSGYMNAKNCINQGNNAGITFPSSVGMLAMFLGL